MLNIRQARPLRRPASGTTRPPCPSPAEGGVGGVLFMLVLAVVARGIQIAPSAHYARRTDPDAPARYPIE